MDEEDMGQGSKRGNEQRDRVEEEMETKRPKQGDEVSTGQAVVEEQLGRDPMRTEITE